MSKIAKMAAAAALLLFGATQAMAVQWDNPDAGPQDEATTQSSSKPTDIPETNAVDGSYNASEDDRPK